MSHNEAFTYAAPKLRLDHTALPTSHLLAKSFHLICNPTRCIDLVTNILAERHRIEESCSTSSKALPPPLFVWEPVPDRCTEDEKENMYQALKIVDVLSPNYLELSGFYGGGSGSRGEIDRECLTSMCTDILLRGFGTHRQGAVVVRAGREGCFVATHSLMKWFPAYHQPSKDAQAGPDVRVVDPTGGGNAFLGGLAVGLVRSGACPSLENVSVAAMFASVAASFAIEQVGMPTLTRTPDGSELWNGISVTERLQEYIDGLASSGIPSAAKSSDNIA